MWTGAEVALRRLRQGALGRRVKLFVATRPCLQHGRVSKSPLYKLAFTGCQLRLP